MSVVLVSFLDGYGFHTVRPCGKVKHMGGAKGVNTLLEGGGVQKIRLLPKSTMMLRLGWVSVEIEKGFGFGEEPLDCV